MSGEDFNHKPVVVEPQPTSEGNSLTAQKLDRLLQTPSGNRLSGYLWLLAILLGAAGLVGWIGWTRFLLPMQMAQQMPAAPPAQVPLAYPESALIEDSADYASTLDSRQAITLQPKVNGQVTAIYVQSGDRVKKGDLIAQVDSLEQQAQVISRKAAVETAAADIAAAQSDVVTAEANLNAQKARRVAEEANVRLAQQEYERFQALRLEGAASQQLVDQRLGSLQVAKANLQEVDAQIQAQTSAISRAKADVLRNQRARDQAQADVAQVKVELQNYKVQAPFTGIVGDVTAKLGDMVSPQSPLLSLTENQELEIEIPIPLERSTNLKLGLPVQLLDDQGETIQMGRIIYIAPTVNANTQSILAKARFQNDRQSLRTAQFVRARVIWSKRPGVLVPTSAISRLGGQDFVFVARPQASASCPASKSANAGQLAIAPNQLVASQQLVKLGKIIGSSQQILEGLQSSDRIVTAGILQLQHCVPIQASPPVTGAS
jgi:RND family efflux transporter MFP subunit